MLHLRFQSTPSREGDVLGQPVAFDNDVFQSTPSREGDSAQQTTTLRPGKFQSTPSREGDLADRADDQPGRVVSIHARGGGGTGCYGSIARWHRAFSTPALGGGRPCSRWIALVVLPVSIHALARGRPSASRRYPPRPGVSIHALARGRPLRWSIASTKPPSFQSTPSREGDREPATSQGLPEGVSIHALARGRPYCRLTVDPCIGCLNPRPRARATYYGPGNHGAGIVSIHALARGRPCSPRPATKRVYLFQSTPSREGDPATNLQRRGTALGFNPRPRARATHVRHV